MVSRRLWRRPTSLLVEDGSVDCCNRAAAEMQQLQSCNRASVQAVLVERGCRQQVDSQSPKSTRLQQSCNRDVAALQQSCNRDQSPVFFFLCVCVKSGGRVS